MTTTSESSRGHIADLMCALRPEWDVAGCVAALRKLDLPLGAVIIAAVRYAEDPANLTPAHLGDLSNRAWDSDWHLPCPTHGATPRRTSGECAYCFSERTEAGELEERQPTPPPAPLRQMAAAHMRGEQQPEEPGLREAERARMEQARLELEKIREKSEA